MPEYSFNGPNTMLIPPHDAFVILFTLLMLLALCVSVAPLILAPPDLRRPKKRTPRVD